MTEARSVASTMVDLRGVRIELVRGGAGRPLVFIHPEIGIAPDAPVLGAFAAHHEVFAPSLPGFGRSELPRDMSEVDDLAYFMLDFLDAYDLKDVALVGASFGGWVAAQMAVKSCERIGALVLAGAAGIKTGDREHRDFVDIFDCSQAELAERMFFDPTYRWGDLAKLSDEALAAHFRNRESAGLFAWSPYMHDPKLRGRLHRIQVPTLVVWGAEDRVVSPDYGRAYAAAIPGARFETIDGAGHLPHVERAGVFVEQVLHHLRS